MKINAEFIVAFLKSHPGIIKSLYYPEDHDGMDESDLYNPDDWEESEESFDEFPPEWYNHNWPHGDGMKASFGRFGIQIAPDLCIEFDEI